MKTREYFFVYSPQRLNQVRNDETTWHGVNAEEPKCPNGNDFLKSIKLFFTLGNW